VTGPEHYQEAERLLSADPPCLCDRTDCAHGRAMVREATAHATLALAAATALRSPVDGLPGRDCDAWMKAAHVREPS